MRYGFKEVVIDSRTGLNPRKNFVLGNGNNNYITIKDIYNGQINITDKTDKVDDEAIQIIKKRSRIKVGDILFVSIGRIGETAIVEAKDDSWDVNESVFVFTLNSEIITPEYFCILFQSDAVQKYLTGNSSGSTFKSIKMNQLEKMVFDLPPLSIQKEITAKLSRAKAICNLRSSELAKLEDLIKARFVEMFGDCDFPQHELASLIKEGAGLSYGIVQPGDDGTGDMGVLRPVDFVDGHISTKSIKYIDRAIGDGFTKTELTGDELLITVRGTTGITALTDKRFAGMNVTRGIAVIRYDRNKINPVYLNAFLNSEGSQRYIKEHTRGATLQQINLADLRVQMISVPPLELQNEFARFMLQVDKSKLAVKKASDEAQLLYDSLMQQYFG